MEARPNSSRYGTFVEEEDQFVITWFINGEIVQINRFGKELSGGRGKTLRNMVEAANRICAEMDRLV